MVIGQDYSWADKNTFRDDCRLIDECGILDFTVFAKFHTGPNIGSAANDAICSDYRIFSDVGKAPDSAALSQARAVADDSGNLYKNVVHARGLQHKAVFRKQIMGRA
jgi:hypothetical protein